MVLLETERNSLLAPLAATVGVVEKRHTLPILSNVLLQKQGEQLTLLATDLELQVSTVLTGKTGEDFAITVAARKLFDIVRALPEDVFFLYFPVFYYVYLHGTYGQTFGKMALKIRVVNEDGSPLDHRKAFLRWLGYFLYDLTFHIGSVWAAFDHRKQGLHDKVCKTLVVRADVPLPSASAMGPGRPEPPARALDTPPDPQL